jgi:hypothetical protein
MPLRRALASLLLRARAWRLFYFVTDGLVRSVVPVSAALAAAWVAELVRPSPPEARRVWWSAVILASMVWAIRRAWRGIGAAEILRNVGRVLRPEDRLLNVWQLTSTIQKAPDESVNYKKGEESPFLEREITGLQKDWGLLRPSRLLRPAGLGGRIARAFAAAAFLAFLAGFPNEGARFAAQRILWPWGAEKAWLSLSPGSVRVAAGESVAISARVLRAGGGAPALYVRQGTAAWEPRDFEAAVDGASQKCREGAADGTFRSVLERVTEPVLYRARYMGLWSGTFRLTPYLPLRFERLTLRVTPPAYTELPMEETENLLSVRAPAGSWIAGDGALDRPAGEARLTRPEEPPVPVDGAPGSRIRFRAEVRRSGVWRFLLRSETGDSSEIPLAVTAVPDAPPEARILSPENDVSLSMRDRLPVVYELSDDYGVKRARLILRTEAGEESGFPLPIEAGVREEIVTAPRLGLSPGDKARIWIEVEDGNPSGPGRGRSAEIALTVTDAAAEREKLWSELESWRSGLRAAAVDEGLLRDKLAGTPDWASLAARQRLAGEGIRGLSDKIDSLLGRMEKDPSADPWLAAEHRAAAEALRDLLRETVPKASSALAGGDREVSGSALKDIEDELDRLARASDSAEKAARARALSNQDALEDAAKDLVDGLSGGDMSPEARRALEGVMREIAESLRDVAEAMSRMPDLLQPPKDMDPSKVLRMEDMLKNLADAAGAASSGDASSALAAARRLLDQVRMMKDILARAGDRYGGEGGLPPELAEAARRFTEKIKAVADRQEKLKSRAQGLWDAAYLRLREEQQRILVSSPTAMLPREPALTEQDRSELGSEAVEESALKADALALRDDLAVISSGTARLGPKERRRLEDAAAEMEKAAGFLREPRPPEAVAAEEEALRLLRESADAMGGLTSGGGIFGGSPGAGRPSGGMPSPWGGAPVGPTRLPRAKDYRPPKEFREDVLRALEEKTPARDRPVIEDYFKRWKN